jgi:hypothetical protein
LSSLSGLSLLKALALINLIGTLALTRPALADNSSFKSEVIALRERVAELERALAERAKAPGPPESYPLPQEVTFCGQTIDLTPPKRRERFKAEVVRALKNRPQIDLYFQRIPAVFPVIEREARALKGCADLKHLAVIESALIGDIRSHAGAVGWWQFMPKTAEQFKLGMQEGVWDERHDLVRSTRAALTYFERLHSAFDDWPLAMAAYNTGRGRLKKAIKAQKTSDFWALDLFTEAERYVPRVLAVHHILSHPHTYDIYPSQPKGWSPPLLTRVTLTLKKGTPRSVRALKYIAKELKLTLSTFKAHNLALIGERLPTKRSLTLWVPPEGVSPLRALLKPHLERFQVGGPLYVNGQTQRLSAGLTPTRGAPLRPWAPNTTAHLPSSPSSKGRYEVSAGESLFSISLRVGVSMSDLRAWNTLSARDPLKIGRSLRLSPP